ncbi:ABC transporter substrate-binding protein [Micromonospora sp. HM5-17]|uniref:substrate-binding periplasmic protein n=1 Tax=Micromonospora sp. HM5-17 TaxID=2487710 RepID=UPI0013152858|nr:transporter substrate-binding domain-containing protein [Micromonospora sp. HM5-17]
MSPHPLRISSPTRWLRTWGPVAALLVVVAVASMIIVTGLRSSPTPPARPLLVSSGDWAPFVGPELPDGGPVTKLVVEVLSRSGYRPEISYTSWTLAEERVRSGASLGMFPMVASASRRADLLLSDPLIDFEYVLFYHRRAGAPAVSTPADLAALRVGGIAGYDYWAELDAAVGELVEFPSTADGFQALADGRVDLLAEGLLSGRAALADPTFAGDAADFGYLPGDNPLVHSVQGLHFMMADTPEAAIVMRKFNRALAEMRRTDEYADLVADLVPAASREVTLTPVGDTGLVELRDAAGRLVLLAPRGTRAQVLAWPDAFLDAAKEPTGRILVRVKVSNGPAQGRVLYVDARALLLTEEGS